MTPILIFCSYCLWHDLPFDARALSLTSFEKYSSSMRLNEGFGLFNFSGDYLLDLNFKQFSFWP